MKKPVYKEVTYDLNGLISYIEHGTIGLPDIQRPFVWKNVRVRNLFDSMYRGYPIGHLLFWQNSTVGGRQIGTDQKQNFPSLLLVDGQQRLTSLYAVIKGIPVIRENYKEEKIVIGFSPIEEEFVVTDAAIRQDKTFIDNITEIWNTSSLYDYTNDFIKRLSESRSLTSDDKGKISSAISNLYNLTRYRFIALELEQNIDAEEVSKIFVLINSEGKKLDQADFILTLMSVFWDEGRAELEKFCRDSRLPAIDRATPYNAFILPTPAQLLRVSVGIAFRRARLKYVYSILRGKDLETEEVSVERRDEQFNALKKAQEHVLNLQNWKDFLKSLLLAGYTSNALISSEVNLLNCYIFYLIGRVEYKVEEHLLRRSIAQLFFMVNVTGRYTKGSDSQMEFDFAELRTVNTADQFIEFLNRTCNSVLTSDFWSITLPADLATSAAVSPSLFAYFAALNLHEAQVLFSQHKVKELLDPATQGNRSSLEKHHLFPKAYLKTKKIVDNREINQIANFTLIEWGENSKISDEPPSKYVPELKARFSANDLKNMWYCHALPDGWENMEYPEFLKARRELMAKVMRSAYDKLANGHNLIEAASISVSDLINARESDVVEFKSTLRTNRHTGLSDQRIELSALKTIAGFINSHGGTLIIGVADDGIPVGLELDKFDSDDKMLIHLDNLIKERIGAQHLTNIRIRFDEFQSTRVLVINCKEGSKAVFVKDGQQEKFYVRSPGASTLELSPSQTQDYIRQHFK